MPDHDELTLACLVALGAERLATMLLQAARSNGLLAGTLRAAVAAEAAPDAVAVEAGRRLTALAVEAPHLDWEDGPTVVSKLDQLRATIVDDITPRTPDRAFALLGRAMIDDALDNGRSKRYRHIARRRRHVTRWHVTVD